MPVDEKRFEDFAARVKEDFQSVRISLASLHKKQDEMFKFKWQIIGGSTALSMLGSIIVAILTLILMTKGG